MTEAPVPVRDMSAEQFQDFTEQLRLLVAEEAPLCDVAGGSTDLGRAGARTRHGPWRPEDCSAALVRWFDAGLLALARYDTDQLVPAGEAAAILRSPGDWRVDAHGANVGPVSTDDGDAVDWEAWTAMLATLRRPA